ncbi:MAG: right-handed parallel beta-helix repeat-containing protein, partial [Lachnospiraceae bacterium]|nr:right-handed parallel beta-helix repeat-containing protein [Lachnospiraceae bacterium]
TIDVQVVAKQMAHEYDSFDNQYDADASFVQAELYVSPDGDDAGAGTADSPFKTLARAQQEVRTMNASMWGDIIVYLADGVYALDDTLTFGVEDGGSNGHYVRYVATGDATISGGRKIEGWSKSSEYENLYVANVANFTGAGIGEMYVNDVYAKRAQSEDYGMILSESDVDTSDNYPTDRLVVDSEVLSKASVTVGDVSDILIRLARSWKGMVFNVEDITDNGDGTSSLHVHLTAIDTGSINWGADPGAGFYVLNAFAELDQPGEFYFDETTGDLYYYPREGEDMATAEVYASELEEILAIEGTHLAEKVENISFENLTFELAAWYGEMEEGFYDQQAGRLYDDNGVASYEIPAGINLTNTNGIQFINNVIKGFHGAGIGLLSGAENTQIVGNVFEDIGDSAVVVGDPDIIKDEAVYGANLTLNKPVTSYVEADYVETTNYDYLVDDNRWNGVWDWSAGVEKYNFMGDFTEATFEVDLGEAHKIHEIHLQTSGSWVCKVSHSIYASAEKITSTADLETRADKIVSIPHDQSYAQTSDPYDQKYVIDDAYKDNEYRYLYYVEDATYAYVYRLAAFDENGDNVAPGSTVTSYVAADYEAVNYDHITNSVTNDGAWDWNAAVEKYNFIGDFTKATFQVDMGDLYSVDKFELQTSSAWVTQVSHSIYGSATPLTSTADIEANADRLVTVPHDQSIAQGVTQTYEVDEQFRGKEYRYLYYVEDSTYSYVLRFAAINETSVNMDAKALPKDNTITDNYITRCGVVNTGAPGVTAYYTHNLDCSYNEFFDLPYSGISLGWGWNAGYLNSVASGNRVAYNEIHNVMQMQVDGASIYTLGHLNGSEITGNYIYDVPNFSGGIYLDQGSAGLDVYNNVLENVPNGFISSKMGNGDGAEISIYDNYVSANEAYDGIAPGYYVEAVFFAPGDYPLEAVEIIRESGIRDEYSAIKAKASERQDELTTAIIYENLMHGDSDIISDGIYRKYILLSYTLYLDQFIDSVKTDGSVGSYPAELVQAVKDQRVVCENLSTAVPQDRMAMAEATVELVDLILEMKESRVTDSMTELIAEAEDKLANAEVGTQVGQIYQSTYDALADAVAVSRTIQESGEVNLIDRVYLEKCIARFDSEKIALDITSFDIPSGLMSAEIDNVNHKIDIVVRQSVDLTNVAPIIGIPNSVTVSPASGVAVDLSDLTEEYTVSTTDGTQSQVWTVNVTKEPVLTGDIILDEMVDNPANWVTGLGGGHEAKYHAQLFGDSTITFNLKIDKHASADWPGIIFRNNVYDQGTSFSPNGVGNGYTIIFNTNDDISVELQRWNSGVRTWFIGGSSGQTLAAKDIFNFGEENKIELTTENVTGGVHIVVKVNDQELIDYTDISPDAVTDPGYLGKFYYYQDVVISAAD